MPGADGAPLDRVFVPAGSHVLVGVRACNRSAALWGPDADTWRPARWLAPLPKAVEAANVPGVYSHLCVPCLTRLDSSCLAPSNV